MKKTTKQARVNQYAQAIKALQDSRLDERAKARGIEPLQKAMARLAKERS